MIPQKTDLRRFATLALGSVIAALQGSIALAATFTWTGATSQDWANPANWNPSSDVPGPTDTARLTGGTVKVGADTSVGTLELAGGQLTGTGTLSVLVLLDWSASSSMTDPGTTIILPGATASLSGSGDRSLVNGRTLLNRGDLIHSGTCRVTLYNGAHFLNDTNATLDLQSDVAWQFTGASACTWVNLGSVTKSAGSGQASFPSLVPVNNGSFSVTSGSLRFPSGVVATNASFHAAQDSFVDYPTDATFQDASFSGPGEQRLSGGTAQLRGAIQADNLLLSGASLRGSASLAGLFSWSSGPINSAASLTLIPGATLRLTGAADRGLTDASRLTVQGTLVHAGPGRLTFYNAAGVSVAQGGTVDLQSDATWQFLGASSSSITNSGSFIKSAGIGTSSIIGLPFHNRGTLGANTGTLSLEIAPSLENGSILAFSLGGPTHPDGHGRIVTTRSLPLSGHLSVGFRSGYQPAPGQLFRIVGAPVRGTFDSFASSPLAPGNFINPVYETDRIDLVVLGPEPIMAGPGRIDAAGRYTLGIRGAVNELYTVEASIDLIEWTPIATNAIPASTLWTFVDADTALWPHRLYRIVHRD